MVTKSEMAGISNATPSSDIETERQSVIKRFVNLLGQQQSLKDGSLSSSGVSEGNTISARRGGVNNINVSELGSLLFEDDTSPIGGGTCSLPSLDLYSGDMPDALENINNSFGRTSDSSKSSKVPPNLDSPKKNVSIPPMAATVLVNREHNSTNPAEANNAAANANANAAILEQAAALNLASKITWTRSSIKLAPSAMLGSLFSSFRLLLESRVKAWTLLLLRHSLSSGDEGSRCHLLRLLATSNSISLSAIETKFQALKLPPEIALSLHKDDQENSSKKSSNSPVEIILPLLFEVVMDLTIQRQQLTSKLRAPGTIKVQFLHREKLISFLQVDLNANTLVESMVEQARLIVFKVVARAKPSSSIHPTPQSALSPTLRMAGKSKIGSNINLAELSLLKNKTSMQEKIPGAIGNNIEENASGSPIATEKTIQKSRSVTWDHPIEFEKKGNARGTSTNGKRFTKRQRISGDGIVKYNGNMPHVVSLKSAKSFGRPDASIFTSRQNATYAEFGRSHANCHVPSFGLNGKLNKQFVATSHSLKTLSASISNGESRNATFSAASISLSNRLEMHRKSEGRKKNSARNFALAAGLSFNK